MNETGLGSIIAQLEQQRDSIERAISALREIQGSGAETPTATERVAGKKRRGGKRRVTAEARKRMSEGQKRRWAEQAGAEAVVQKKSAKKARAKKRAISPEGRARIAEAAKKMWAKKRAGAKKRTAKPGQKKQSSSSPAET